MYGSIDVLTWDTHSIGGHRGGRVCDPVRAAPSVEFRAPLSPVVIQLAGCHGAGTLLLLQLGQDGRLPLGEGRHLLQDGGLEKTQDLQLTQRSRNITAAATAEPHLVAHQPLSYYPREDAGHLFCRTQLET